MLKTENGLIIRACKVLMLGKIISAYFEYNFEELDNNELRIDRRRTNSFTVKQWKSITIKKQWISWNNFSKR